MPRTMYDSTTAGDIPASAEMVAGYIDGAYAWSDADWRRFPNARKVSITVGSGTFDAQVADVETGDYSMDQGVAWAKAKINLSQPATLYFSLSRAAEFYAAAARQGLQSFGWYLWIADWNGDRTMAPNWIAKQYAHPPDSGGHYDLSVVADYWPGVDPPPAPTQPPAIPPPPAPTQPPAIPPPPPSPVQGVNDTRAAWSRLGDVLVTGVQAAYNYLRSITQHLKDL